MKRNILILSMGGTISSAGGADSSDYEIGVRKIESIASHLPLIANLDFKELVNIDSALMDIKLLLKLSNALNEALEDNNIHGIVVTHGTDTLEESAFFAHLTTHSKKPIVFTGSMRPTTSMLYDGYRNLYSAILVAINPNSINKGVMIVMNDKIHSARYATKSHTTDINAFTSTFELGYIANDIVHFNPLQINRELYFDVSREYTLPNVPIIYSHVTDIGDSVFDTFYNADLGGVVMAGYGAGNLNDDYRKKFAWLITKGICIVISSRVGNGSVVLNQKDIRSGFIGAKDLNPQKASMLLSLAKAKGAGIDIAFSVI